MKTYLIILLGLVGFASLFAAAFVTFSFNQLPTQQREIIGRSIIVGLAVVGLACLLGIQFVKALP